MPEFYFMYIVNNFFFQISWLVALSKIFDNKNLQLYSIVPVYWISGVRVYLKSRQYLCYALSCPAGSTPSCFVAVPHCTKFSQCEKINQIQTHSQK